ncbi:MAG: pyruvate kinase [Patescibacteria group bacterium]|jgi:pyruvate kinase
MNFKQTKIVATLGPASDNPETVKQLIESGVNVFRFNMKHADIAWHHERINMVQKVADEMRVSVGILIDLQGPEIRIETRDHQDVPIKQGERVVFADTLAEDVNVCIPHDVVFGTLKVGDTILVADGFLEFAVVEVRDHSVVVEAQGNYVIKHRKGVNLPGKKIDLPSLIEDDLRKLDMAGKAKVDIVALSFSRTKKDIQILRQEMEKRHIDALIMAKIESQEAIDHLDELIQTSDAIMVARGDLGIEVPIEQLAYWQKHIITECRKYNKPVITATQMLESMIENPRPTRAEAVDVANAVFDGTDAVMLSAESASGKYPVKAVQHMARIAEYTEKKSRIKCKDHAQDVTGLIIHAAESMLDTENHPKVDGAVVFTETGYTARVLSACRPKFPIIAVSRSQKTVEKLTLSYGVQPFCIDYPRGDYSLPKEVFDELKKKKLIEKGQKLLVIHGLNWQYPGGTNTLTLLTVV